MEENTKAKTVAMGKEDVKEEKRQKLTYEQLNDACNQLWQQNKQLAARNRELEQFVMNRRLEYLFKVLEFKDMFTSDFVISCSSEIEEGLTIPQEKSKEEEK